jgi:hypothetical protein
MLSGPYQLQKGKLARPNYKKQSLNTNQPEHPPMDQVTKPPGTRPSLGQASSPSALQWKQKDKAQKA